ncbi:MAG: hypothetical protein ABIJ45_14705 [Candidatus Zixiibacteriota bacterium]
MKTAILLIMAFLVLVGSGFGNDSTLVSFEIEDQFKNDHTDKEFRGKVAIFLTGDRKGIDFCDPWIKVISDSVAESIGKGIVVVQKMANVKGVPFFIKGAVRKKFKEESGIVLLDWKGVFLKAYDFEKDKANILLFSSESKLEFQKWVAEFNYNEFKQIIEQIRILIK